MFSPDNLKMIMMMAGIQKLNVKFNCEKKVIEAEYTRFGQTHKAEIPFQTIETIFPPNDDQQSGSLNNSGSSRIDDPNDGEV